MTAKCAPSYFKRNLMQNEEGSEKRKKLKASSVDASAENSPRNRKHIGIEGKTESASNSKWQTPLSQESDESDEEDGLTVEEFKKTEGYKMMIEDLDYMSGKLVALALA